MFILFSFSFFLPNRQTHLHEREGDGKRNILWGWPSRVHSRQSIVFQREEASLRRLNLIFDRYALNSDDGVPRVLKCSD